MSLEPTIKRGYDRNGLTFIDGHENAACHRWNSLPGDVGVENFAAISTEQKRVQVQCIFGLDNLKFKIVWEPSYFCVPFHNQLYDAISGEL